MAAMLIAEEKPLETEDEEPGRCEVYIGRYSEITY